MYYGKITEERDGLVERLRKIVKREPVLCISALCALISMIVVPPGPAYAGYIDVRVICLLFCLMAVVLGLQECGVFKVLAGRLLSVCRDMKALRMALVMLPFFCSMLVTNDVALITFVPFALLILGIAERRELAIRVVVLQTIAANLGSMATPVGNPQNLFLYANYELSPGEFFAVVIPVSVISLVGLVAAVLFNRSGTVVISLKSREELKNRRALAVYVGLFVLCLFSVFRVIPYWVTTIAVVSGFCIVSPRLLKRVDYCLLMTFVCFFVFAGNLAQIPGVSDWLRSTLSEGAMLPSVISSQVISNVPAAVLLAGFTDNWKGLLLGTNIGGLGTPVASLASLISLKLYLREPDSRPGKYLAVFMAANVIGLVMLSVFAWLFFR